MFHIYFSFFCSAPCFVFLSFFNGKGAQNGFILMYVFLVFLVLFRLSLLNKSLDVFLYSFGSLWTPVGIPWGALDPTIYLETKAENNVTSCKPVCERSRPEQILNRTICLEAKTENKVTSCKPVRERFHESTEEATKRQKRTAPTRGVSPVLSAAGTWLAAIALRSFAYHTPILRSVLPTYRKND